MSRSIRFASSAAWNIAGQLAVAALGLWLVPLIVRQFGASGYALYGLLGTVAGYLTLLSFGSGPSTTKFVSELLGSGSREALGSAIALSLAAHVGGVALGALLVFDWRGGVAGVFNVDPHLATSAAVVFGCSAAASVFVSLHRFAGFVLHGRQRFGLSNLLNVIEAGGTIGGAALLLKAGRGIEAIALFYVCAYAALSAASCLLAFRGLGAVPRWGRDPESQLVRRRFVRFSLLNFAGMLTWSIPYQLDKVFVGRLVSLSELAYYMVPASLLQKLTIIPGGISGTAFPLFSELHATGDQEGLRKAYRQTSQLLLWAVLPAAVLLMLLAPQFLTLWIGETFSTRGTWPLRLLLCGYLLNYMAAIPTAAVYGTGHLLRYSSGVNAALACLCILFWRLLTPRFGIAGAAGAFFLAHLAAYVPYILLVNRRLFAMGGAEYLETICLRPLACGGLLFACLWPLRAEFYTWGALLATGLGAGAAYLAFAWWLLDAEGRSSARFLLQAVTRRARASAAAR